MTLAVGLAAGLASFLHVGLRAGQSVNVVTGARLGPQRGRGYYLAVPPVALGIAVADVFIVSAIVGQGWALALPLAIGGALGCYAGMLIHHKLGGKP